MKRFLLAITLLLCGVAFAIEINVPGDYASIQSAINAANDYDVIVLEVGIWTGAENTNIDFNGKLITLRSTDPDNPAVVAGTIIDGEGSSRIFTFDSGEGSDARVSGLTVTNGYSNLGGGFYIYSASPVIDRCVISLNAADTEGGAIHCTDSEAVFIDCIIEENSSPKGGGVYCENSSTITVDNCVFQGNTCNGAGYGAAIHLRNSNALFKGCYIEGNYNDGSVAEGGAVYVYGCDPVFSSCIIAGNRAKKGAAFFCNYYGDPVIKNCTVYGNFASINGSALYCYRSLDPSVSNSILWQNTPNEIYLDQLGGVTVDYSDVMGGYTGTGNIDADPMFVAAGYWDDNGTAGDPSDDFWVPGDLHIDYLSPCFNAGDPTYVMSACEVDIDMDDRVRLGRVDMGADETGSIPGDITEDGIVNYADLAKLGYSWGSSEGETEYNKLCDLAEPADGTVGPGDLVEFGSFWLDEAPWY